MGLFDKKNALVIEEEDLRDAKLSSASLGADLVKKRAFMNVLGARLAIKYLFSKKIEANNVYSLYTIQSILKECDLSDIYYQGIRMDVRLVFNREEIFIPKIHYAHNLTPDIYLVFELQENMSQAEFLGFFTPENIDKANQNKDFYFQPYENLQDPKNIKDFLKDFKPTKKQENIKVDMEQTQELFMSVIDKELNNEKLIYLIKQLSVSFELREKLVEFENFELISEHILKDDEIMQDGMLNIIGAQKVLEDNSFEDEDSDDELSQEPIIEDEDFAQELSQEPVIEDEDFAQELSQEPVIEDDDFGQELNLEPIIIDEIKPQFEETITNTNNIEEFGNINENDIELSDLETEIAEDIEVNPNAIELENTTSQLDEEDLSFDDDSFELGENVENKNEPPIKTAQEEISDLDFEIVEADSIEALDDLPSLDFGGDNDVPEYIKKLKMGEDSTAKNVSIDDLEILTDNNAISDSKEEVEKETSDAVSFDMDDDNLLELDEPEILSLDDLVQDDDNVPTESVAKPEKQTEEEEKYEEEYKEEDKTDMLKVSMFDEDSSREEKLMEELSAIDDDFGTETPSIQNKNEDIKSADDFDVSDNLLSEVDDLLSDVDLSTADLSGLENLDLNYDLILPNESNEPNQLNEENIVTNNDEDEGIPLMSSNGAVLEQINDGTIDESQKGKDPLQVLYKGEDPNFNEFYDNGKKSVSKQKNKKIVIAASVACMVLGTFIVGGLVINNLSKNKSDSQLVTSEKLNNDKQDMFTEENETIGMLQQNDQNLQNQVEMQSQTGLSADMGQAVSNAFMSEPVSANITKIAWEVPEDLAYNDGFRKYLQMAGKNLKLNLQNDLLLVSDLAYSNKLIIDLLIGKDGDLIGSNIVASSNSKQIDKVVLQSVKNTLKYLKVPSDELGGRNADVTLIINF